MRLLGIDPNGFAQRIQSQMTRAANRLERARRSDGAEPTPSTRHKVSVRRLPLRPSALRAAPPPAPAQAQSTATGQPPPDPVATRAIAEFTQAQPRPAGTDALPGVPRAAARMSAKPVLLLDIAQRALGAPSRARLIGLAGRFAVRLRATFVGCLKTYDGAIRTAAVLAIALGIALAIAIK